MHDRGMTRARGSRWGAWTRGLTLIALITSSCGDDGGADASTSAPATTALDDGSTGPAGESSGTGPADDTSDGGMVTSTGPGPADSSSSEGSSTGPGVEPCAPDHVCFILDGVFHEPDEVTPTATYDIPLPAGQDFRIVEVTVTVTHGGWYPDDPAGLHNLFWLHRGTFDDFTWMGGVIGYVNARGPGTNVIRTRHDLDVTDLADSQTFNINGVSLQEGSTYRVFYRYDTAAAEVLVEITEGGMVVAQGTDVPTTDLVRNTEGSAFIYFANGTDVAAPGPEVPSLGWTFADLRVEFIP